MPKVVITMPAYQAERTLERTVLAIPPGVADELILVDDASRDGTAELARTLGLRVHVHPNNRGYGGNQKSCYQLALEADADIVVLLHPDYQYEPKAVPLLIAPILAGEADMTFGSRFAGMGDPLGGGMPLYRYLGNRLTTIAQNLCLGTRFTDMHSGMRAYTRRALESLPFLGYPDGFSFDAELLVDAVTSGLRVVEVPIPTRYTLESSSISVSRSLEYVIHGTLYAAKRGAERGRRGQRYLPRWRSARVASVTGPEVVRDCPVCGATRLRAIQARAHGSGEILRCPSCGVMRIDPPAESTAEAPPPPSDPTIAREVARYWAPIVDGEEAVVILDGLETADDPNDLLRRTRKDLHERGVLAIATRSTDRPSRLAASSSQERLAYPPATLTALLARNGFDVVERLATPSGPWAVVIARPTPS